MAAVAVVAGEICDSNRRFLLAFRGGVSLVSADYPLSSVAFLSVLAIAQIASATGFVAQLRAVLFGVAGALVASLSVVVLVCGGIAALTMAAPQKTPAIAQSAPSLPLSGGSIRALGRPASAVLFQTLVGWVLAPSSISLRGFPLPRFGLSPLIHDASNP